MNFLLADARNLLPLGGALLGYALMMAANPVRPSMRDGLRCLRRYPALWVLPAFLNVCHALFRFGVRVFESALLPGAEPLFAPWSGSHSPDWAHAAAEAVLPALEGAAGVFNATVGTFPLSALAALLFLVNWRGYQGVLSRALQRRIGTAAGLSAHAGLMVCALAAAVRPALFAGGLLRLNTWMGAVTLLRLGAAVDFFGKIFEQILATGLQVYLILLAYAWVRGLHFNVVALRRFALRRLSFVLKWAAVVLVAGALLIDIPLALAISGDSASAAGSVLRWVGFARWLLAVALLCFCAVQITLVFHNESLRRALADHVRLLRRHGGRIGWLAGLAGFHFFFLNVLDVALRQALGDGTWPTAFWSLLYSLLWAVLGSWLLASWVCLFRRCESGRPDAEELVRF